jgi:hypothetical protein
MDIEGALGDPLAAGGVREPDGSRLRRLSDMRLYVL